ncbi:hypothetical protein ACIA3K_13645 [Micromonospora sp. NPDC051543]|uniref:hypothetical protein n=1 Tax=Micromonospora sp. NPDC051543 TaxID=3364287 RepID=UPI00379865B5
MAALFLASAAITLTAACGGGSADEPSDKESGGANAFAAYTACMADNGVTITMPSGGPRSWPSAGASRGPRPSRAATPRPSGSAGPRGGAAFGGGGFGKPAGVDDATWQKAQEACSSVRPSAGTGNGNRPGARGRNAAYENCLKENGVTLTDGQPTGTDAVTQKALQTCAVLRPNASATPPA